MKRLPIRLRLTIWYLVVFSVALTAFGFSVWLLVRQRLYAQVNAGLRSEVANLQHYMSAQPPDITRAAMINELKEDYDEENQGTWLQVLDENGQWLFRSQDIAAILPKAEPPSSVPLDGKIWAVQAGNDRLEVIEKPISVFGKQYTVETAQKTDGVNETLSKLANTFLLLAPAFVVMAAIGSYFMSKRGFATVDEITAMARSIHENNLDSRLPSLNTNDELQRLSDTLNDMLARIESSFKRMREFTADASHELRTPVSLIRTESELALRKTRTDAEYRAALTHILTESIRTSDMIESLLALARTDSGVEELQLHPLRCVLFLKQVAEDCAPMFAHADLRFMSHFPAEEVLVQADVSSLRRLVLLLLDNACKYTPEGGEVTLQAAATSDEVTISVSDTGVGIEPQHLPRIFDRFYRVDAARGREQGGAGLGLALAKWIATQHHTSIEVHSSRESGTTFSFRLQRVPGQNANRVLTTSNSETESVL